MRAWISPSTYDELDGGIPDSTSEGVKKMRETIDLIERRENVLRDRAANEKRSAIEFMRQKNERSARISLARKKIFEDDMNKLGAIRLDLVRQQCALEDTGVNAETVRTMRLATEGLTAMKNAVTLDKVQDAQTDVQIAMNEADMISESLAAPGEDAVSDDKKLKAELDDLMADDLQNGVPPEAAIPTFPVVPDDDELMALRTKVKNVAATVPV